MRLTLAAATLALLAGAAVPALAYDGTKCKAAGDCWEPKPGFPDKIAGRSTIPSTIPRS